jgi:hypothetical protein
LLGILDAIFVYAIFYYGLRHNPHPPEKPEESNAVKQLREMNAERLAKIEAARARQLPSGEAKPS